MAGGNRGRGRALIQLVTPEEDSHDRSVWIPLATSFGFTNGALNVLIFDQKALLVYPVAAAEVESSALDEMVAAVRAARVEKSQTSG